MDALSEVFTFLKPSACITGYTIGHSPWAMNFTGYDYVKFGFVAEGECWLSYRGAKPLLLEQGDAWLLIKPVEFQIGSDLSSPLFRSEDVFKAPGPKYTVGKKTTKSQQTTIFGGRLDFDGLNAGFLLDNLPKVIVLKAASASPTLRHILRVLQHESLTEACGSQVVIESIIPLIFIESLRTLNFKSLKGGSLKGLTHPAIGKVISAIHKDYRRNWTVAELSLIYGASRSSFAASFKATVGLSPMDYLQRWRMLLAQEELRTSQKRVSEIAYGVGYESVTAFSTAFSKVVGQAPKNFRDSQS